jgi:membrane associated rhomboid family serine protease
MWIAVQVISSLADPTGTGGVAYLAHIGGFGAGVLAGLLFRALPDRGAGPAALR